MRINDSVFSLIRKATEEFSDDLIGFKSSAEFDKALIHIENLILSAITLIEKNNHATAQFLIITAIEEMAKAEICIYRRENKKNVKRSKDALFRHSTKHKISANPIILIGNRLKNILGSERVKEIFQKFQNGGIAKERENTLYFYRTESVFHIPGDSYGAKDNIELLLIAIEMMDDKFWGLTERATEICENLNILFRKYSNELTKQNSDEKKM